MKSLVLALLMLTAAKQHIPPTDNRITWDATNKLTWDDFKAAPDKKTDLVAMTYSSIYFGYSVSGNILSIEITAAFDKETSWTKDDTSTYLLNHEQLHFDITEVLARKFRKAVSETMLTKKNYETVIRELHGGIIKEWKKYQGQYDEETDNSLKKDVQATWDEKIAQELDSLKDYTVTEFKVIVD